MANYTRKKHSSQDQTQTSDDPLPLEISSRIDHSLLKAWVMAGIPFEVIKNPFILDLFKNLNLAYVPPSRTTLSDRCLNEKISRVGKKVKSELKMADNLTLSKKN